MSAHIRFKNGLVPSIHRFYQHDTYYGLIEGAPNTTMNAKIIQSSQEQAKRMFHLDNICLLQPEEKIFDRKTPVDAPPSVPVVYRATLPKVVCMVELSSHTVKDQDAEWSRLGLVWFQDEYAFPIDAFVRHQIEQLDWAELSVDDYY